MATIAKERTVPDHVPTGLVVDVDIYNIPGGSEEPQGFWRIFQGRGPLVWSAYNGGHWIAAEGKAVFRFFRDLDHFSSSAVAIPDPVTGCCRSRPIRPNTPNTAPTSSFW